MSSGCAPFQKRSTSCKRVCRARSIRSSRIISSDEATIRRSDFWKALPRIQLDDQLLVDDRLHLVARWDVRDFSLERIAIDREPIRHRHDLSQFEIAEGKLTRFRFVFDRNLVARFHVVRGNVDVATVDLNMAMGNKLTRSIARVCQSKAVNNVIEPSLKQLQQRFTSDTAFAQRVFEYAAKLALEQSVLVTELLFFAERDGVFRLLAPRTFRSVHARRIIFPFKRFGWSKNLDAVTAAHSCFRSGVSAHEIC